MPNNALPWWKKAVFYQVYPRSFQDSTGNGMGDLNGISNHLEYIRDLGIEGLWISPFLQSPQKDFGYDVSDYRKVDPIYGRTEDIDRLIKKAKRLGIRIIMDLVLSHTSDEHDWFVESRSSRNNPKADWYVWADPKPDGTPPNNWQSSFGGSAWQYDSRRGQYYLHNWHIGQPDLNFHNKEVQKHTLNNIRYWIERGCGGFRLDVINYMFHDQKLRDNPPNPSGLSKINHNGTKDPYQMQKHVYDISQPEALGFIEKIRSLCDEYTDIMLLGEIGDDNPYELTAAYTANKRLHTCYNTSLMAGISVEFKSSMISTSFKDLKDGGVTDDFLPSWAFSNHDVVRVATRWAGKNLGHPQICKMYMAILLSLKGCPYIYQGEELGLPEANIPYEKIQDPWGKYMWPEYQGRDGCRTPMPWTHDRKHCGFTEAQEPWLPIPASHSNRAVDLQEKDPNSVLNFTKGFIAWRKNQNSLIAGDIEFLDTGEDILAYKRNDILCVFNLRNKEQEIQFSEKIEELNSFGSWIISNDNLNTLCGLSGFGFGFFRIIG